MTTNEKHDLLNEYAAKAYSEGYRAIAARHSDVLADTVFEANANTLANMYEVLTIAVAVGGFWSYYHYKREAA